ncbi:hypothetical protein BU25DRAFT_406388 [Macroventuria anomochaeta]|uniref:Uncharacterized protein n=1 Tax=Macroventuria anomochaeta TaxID=301207 RepID=A0ACB6SEE2_9PLEO|nr:uncharacterized protein BU25DRAFT_406388 [Macroventuria anomochaeta]KAF2631857.1 hypothetical protein BU25DRAFT_406388 [Macroventuria anomochaeta]
MHSNSMFAILAALSLAAATPIDYSLQARGNTPSKPADIQCSGEIIGYRTIVTQANADKVNIAKTFPKDQPGGIDLGSSSVYFSDGLGDWKGAGTGVNWCIAYADSAQLKAANKVWFTEDQKLLQCTRFSDANVNAYINMVSNNKFTPASTLRFSELDKHLQVAIPFAMLDKMKVCGKCFPRAEAEKMVAQYPRVNWNTSVYKVSNTRLRRNGLDARAPATCPLKASPTPKGKSTPTPTPKGKSTPTPTPKGKSTPTPTPKGKSTPTPKGKAAPTPTGKKPRADFKP